MVIHLPQLDFSLRLIGTMDDEILHRHARASLNAKAEFLHVSSLARFGFLRQPQRARSFSPTMA